MVSAAPASGRGWAIRPQRPPRGGTANRRRAAPAALLLPPFARRRRLARTTSLAAGATRRNCLLGPHAPTRSNCLLGRRRRLAAPPLRPQAPALRNCPLDCGRPPPEGSTRCSR